MLLLRLHLPLPLSSRSCQCGPILWEKVGWAVGALGSEPGRVEEVGAQRVGARTLGAQNVASFFLSLGIFSSLFVSPDVFFRVFFPLSRVLVSRDFKCACFRLQTVLWKPPVACRTSVPSDRVPCEISIRHSCCIQETLQSSTRSRSSDAHADVQPWAWRVSIADFKVSATSLQKFSSFLQLIDQEPLLKCHAVQRCRFLDFIFCRNHALVSHWSPANPDSMTHL